MSDVFRFILGFLFIAWGFMHIYAIYYDIEQTRALTRLYNRSRIWIDTEDLQTQEVFYVSPGDCKSQKQH